MVMTTLYDLQYTTM